MVECDEVKTIEDCHECATMDAYSDDEVAAGWLTCLGDMLDNIEECECLGEIVAFKGVAQRGLTIFAEVAKSKQSALVALESVKFLTPTKEQSLWVKAYTKYQDF
jgi:hypothetical protein